MSLNSFWDNLIRTRAVCLARRYVIWGALIWLALGPDALLRAQDPPRQPQEEIPIEMNPNDPMASREERIRRQREMLKQRIERRRQREAQDLSNAKSPMSDPTKRPDFHQAPMPGIRPPNVSERPGRTPPPPQAALGSKETDKPHVTIFMQPGSLIARAGARFSTRCRLLNPDHLSLDRVELCLTYPRFCIQPVAIHQSELHPLLAGEPICQLDERAGTIHYSGKLRKPLNALEVPLITIVWKALQPADSALIRPLIGERYSAAYWKNQSLIAGATNVSDAVSGAHLTINAAPPKVPRGNRLMDTVDENRQLMEAGFRDQSTLRLPTLWIHQESTGTLETGQWVIADVGISNPDRMVFDEVRLALNYSPADVEIVDSDRGNWINEGVNLLDGPFHKNWPWDLLYSNSVDPKRGLVFYHVGTSSLKEQPSGPLVRIFAKLKKPLQGPVFKWIWEEEKAPAGQPSTGIYLYNTNLYRRGRSGRSAKESITRSEAGLDKILHPDIERAEPDHYRF